MFFSDAEALRLEMKIPFLFLRKVFFQRLTIFINSAPVYINAARVYKQSRQIKI